MGFPLSPKVTVPRNVPLACVGLIVSVSVVGIKEAVTASLVWPKQTAGRQKVNAVTTINTALQIFLFIIRVDLCVDSYKSLALPATPENIYAL
jgi:hypothetical protein